MTRADKFTQVERFGAIRANSVSSAIVVVVDAKHYDAQNAALREAERLLEQWMDAEDWGEIEAMEDLADKTSAFLDDPNGVGHPYRDRLQALSDKIGRQLLGKSGGA